MASGNGENEHVDLVPGLQSLGSQGGEQGVPDVGIQQTDQPPVQNQPPVQQQSPVQDQPPVQQPPVQQQPPETPGPPQQQPSFLEAVQQAGLQAESEDDVLRLIQEQQQQLQQQQQAATFGQQVMPYAQQFQQFLQQQYQQQQPADTPPEDKTPGWQAHEAEYWKAPEYDPQWERMVRMNPETGQYEGINNMVPIGAVQQVQQHYAWQKQQLEKLVNNPFEVVREGMQPWLEHFIGEQINNSLSKHNQDAEMARIEDELAPYIYQQTPTGGYDVDPMTNTYRLNEYGQMFATEVQKFKGMGIEDPRQLRQLAEQSIKAQVFDTMQQQSQGDDASSQQAPAQGPGQPEPQGKKESFLENSRRRQAQHSGQLGGRLSQPDTLPESDAAAVEGESFFTDNARLQGHLKQ